MRIEPGKLADRAAHYNYPQRSEPAVPLEEREVIRTLVSGVIAAGLALLVYPFEDTVNNGVGFTLLLIGPLVIGLLCAMPKITARKVLANGMAAAACGGLVLGFVVASASEEGGPLVVIGTATVAFGIAVLPVLTVALGATMFRRMNRPNIPPERHRGTP